METYKKLYSKFNSFIHHLEKYAVSNRCVNDSFYVAKRILSDLLSLSYRSERFASEFLDYFLSGSTIKLKRILLNNDFYNESNLIHFNAMCLIDSAKVTF